GRSTEGATRAGAQLRPGSTASPNGAALRRDNIPMPSASQFRGVEPTHFRLAALSLGWRSDLRGAGGQGLRRRQPPPGLLRPPAGGATGAAGGGPVPRTAPAPGGPPSRGTAPAPTAAVSGPPAGRTARTWPPWIAYQTSCPS